MDLGIRGESKTLKRAESVFRENPEVKQILYYLRLVPGHGQSSSTFRRNVPFFGLFGSEEFRKYSGDNGL